MKKTLSNCSPAILGMAQKAIALIHSKCHFDYDRKQYKGSWVPEQALPGRLGDLLLWRTLDKKKTCFKDGRELRAAAPPYPSSHLGNSCSFYLGNTRALRPGAHALLGNPRLRVRVLLTSEPLSLDPLPAQTHTDNCRRLWCWTLTHGARKTEQPPTDQKKQVPWN